MKDCVWSHRSQFSKTSLLIDGITSPKAIGFLCIKYLSYDVSISN